MNHNWHNDLHLLSWSEIVELDGKDSLSFSLKVFATAYYVSTCRRTGGHDLLYARRLLQECVHNIYLGHHVQFGYETKLPTDLPSEGNGLDAAAN